MKSDKEGCSRTNGVTVCNNKQQYGFSRSHSIDCEGYHLLWYGSMLFDFDSWWATIIPK